MSRDQKVEAYQQRLEAQQQVAGGRVPVRTEHTGISEHPSTRVHAAPGGNSSFSFSDGSAPEPASCARPDQMQPQPSRRQQMSLSPQQADAEQHAAEQRQAANAIRDRARGGRSLW